MAGDAAPAEYVSAIVLVFRGETSDLHHVTGTKCIGGGSALRAHLDSGLLFPNTDRMRGSGFNFFTLRACDLQDLPYFLALGNKFEYKSEFMSRTSD